MEDSSSQVSIKDVAKKAGVSLASVSQTFRNPLRVGEEVRNKVLAAADEIGYIPKFIAKRTAYGNIGLLIDQRRGPFGEFYSHIIMGVLEKARQLKWNISLELYDSLAENIFPPMIKEKKVDGVILLSKHEDSFIQTLMERRLPYCVVDYYSDRLSHNTVYPDWYQGACLACEYLVKNGHKRIAMVHSPLEKGAVSRERIAGYNDTMEKYSLPFIDGYMVDGKFSYMESYKVTKGLMALSARPTAIFCATDVMAMGAYKAIKEAGLRIPQQISVVGIDNIEVPYYMDPLEPGLTTIDGDKNKMGQTAVQMVQDLILQKIEPPKKIVLPMKMVVRDSVRELKG
jgi:LacI family transcriptional regulator